MVSIFKKTSYPSKGKHIILTPNPTKLNIIPTCCSSLNLLDAHDYDGPSLANINGGLLHKVDNFKNAKAFLREVNPTSRAPNLPQDGRSKDITHAIGVEWRVFFFLST